MATHTGYWFSWRFGDGDANTCDCAEASAASVVLAETPSANIAQTGDDLGTDFDFMTDIKPSFVLASGLRNIANAIVRRLQTPPGFFEVFGGDPNYGYDILSKLNASMSTSEIAEIEKNVKEQCERDERIKTADVSATYSMATSILNVEIALLLEDGVTFSLILHVSQLGVEVFSATAN